MSDEPQYLLLPLASDELDPVIWALTAFASVVEESEPTLAEVCDRIADRAHCLDDLAIVGIYEWIKHDGVGRYKMRPQG